MSRVLKEFTAFGQIILLPKHYFRKTKKSAYEDLYVRMFTELRG